jgi:hypothetical protein
MGTPELAALTGMGDQNPAQRTLYPGRDGPSTPGQQRGPAVKPYDPTEDDPLDAPKGRGAAGDAEGTYVVAPSITVRPEFPSLTRSTDPSQPLTAIVVVELPSRRNPAASPRPAPPESYGPQSPPVRRLASPGVPAASTFQSFSGPPSRTLSPAVPVDVGGSALSPRGMDPRSLSMASEGSYADDTPDEDDEEADEAPSAAFAAITEDLKARIIDWKNHPMSSLGTLQMYDLLRVRREAVVREFFVYLFKEAIICVAEERRRTIGRLVQSVTGERADGGAQAKGVLRLKGRIYIRHIRQVTDTSTAGELSLTIDMEDERLDSFILVFPDRPSLETWKRHVQRLVALFQRGSPSARARAEQRAEQERAACNLDLDEFGGSAKAARMLSGATGSSGGTGSSSHAHDSLLASSRSVASTATSASGAHPRHLAPPSKPLSPLGEEEELRQYDPAGGFVTPHLSAGPSNALPPVPHAPLDLILVVSVPPAHAPPATAALKVRVLKNALDFVLAQLGPRDRVSLVTFEMGAGGAVRKTPFLAASRTQSRARLSKFVDEIGYRPEEGAGFKDEFAVRIQEEKTDVVTAINHGGPMGACECGTLC